MEDELAYVFNEYFKKYKDELIDDMRTDAIKYLTKQSNVEATHVVYYLKKRLQLIEWIEGFIDKYGIEIYCQYVPAWVDNCIVRIRFRSEPEMRIRFSIRRAYSVFKNVSIHVRLEDIAEDVRLALVNYRASLFHSRMEWKTPMTDMYRLVQHEIYLGGDDMLRGIMEDKEWDRMIVEEQDKGARVLLNDDPNESIFTGSKSMREFEEEYSKIVTRVQECFMKYKTI